MAQRIVQGEIYQDTKSGTINLAAYAGFGADMILVVDISAINDNQTKIITHYSRNSLKRYGQVVKYWVIDNSTECDLMKYKYDNEVPQ